MKKILTVAALSLAVASTAQAEIKFDKKALYVGGGLVINSYDASYVDSTATSFQFFGGYNLNLNLADKVTTAIEVGYMDYGEADIKVNYGYYYGSSSASWDMGNGIFASGLVRYEIADKINALGRIGLDIGDDDGLLFGFGGEYTLTEQLGIRAEYVIRSNINSFQINGTFSF